MRFTAPLSALAASGLLLAGAGPVLAADDPQSGALDAAQSAAAAPLAPADSPQSADAAQSAAPAAAPSAPMALRGAPSPVSIDLVGITDFHGHIEKVTAKDGTVTEPGAATLACEVEKARTANPNTLFVSNGDNVGGSAYTSSILKDQPTIDALNAMKLDVTSAGNHEFDQGIGDLAGRLIPAFDAPILSANVTGNAALTAEGDGDGTFVKDVAGVKVGFVGVVTEELPSLVSASAIEGLTVAKAVDTANARATELKSSGRADVVVVLAHADAELNGGQFNGDVDAVFGGHTHLPFAQVLKSTAGTDIAVVQADHYGLLLGKVGLTLSQTDGKWSVTARTASNTDLTKSDCADADGVAAIVAKAKTDAEAAGATVVATLGSDFRRGTNDGTDYGANRSTESTASDLIADSFQNWIATGIKPAADHYVGLMNPGGVRADYEAGELTEGEAYQVQPFGNEMAYATYTGAQFRQILAQQFQPTTSRPALMLGLSKNVQVCLDQSAVSELEGYYEQIQGATLDARDALIASLASAIDDARARVISCVMIDGAPLGDGDAIAVASNSFLLAGGDNFTKLGDSAMTNTGILDRTVTGEYLAGLGNATADLAKRQSGVSATIAESKASIELAGLLYTATSEQGTGAAAKTVAATVMLADGTVKEVATSSIDPEITAGLPDTGTASLTVEVPAGVATAACTDSQWAGKQCATVSLTITAVDGSTRTLPCTYEVPVPVEAEAPAPTEEPAAPAAQPAAPAAKAPQLAKTGADSVGLLAGALALAMAGALAVARKR